MKPSSALSPDFPTTRAMLAEFIAKKRELGRPVSLRSYARHFGVSAAYLSRVLAGKRKIPTARVEEICDRITAPKEWKKLFRQVALYENSDLRDRSELANQVSAIIGKYPEYTMLSDAAFQVIHGWHHAAIIELTKVRGFRADANWIANRLSVHVLEVRLAVDRLLRLGYLTESKNTWIASAPGFAVPDVPSLAIRQYHLMMLAKARFALEKVPMHRRNFQSSIVATTEGRIIEANQKIGAFIDDLTRWLEAGEQDCLYAVGIQAFPLEKLD